MYALLSQTPHPLRCSRQEQSAAGRNKARRIACTSPLPLPVGLQVGARSRPSGRTTTNGDWHDVIALPGGAVGLVIGDVMGHDVTAAVAKNRLAAITRSLAQEDHSPAVVLDRADQILQAQGIPTLATVIAARLVLDSGGGLLRYANAGHPPPLLRRSSGGVKVLGASSLLLGVPFAQAEPRDESMAAMAFDSTLLLYTDGLIERHGASFEEGQERLIAAFGAQDPGLDPLAVCDELCATMLEGDPDDDVALVAVRVVAPVVPEAISTMASPTTPR